MIFAFLNFFKAWLVVQWATWRHYEILSRPSVQESRFQSCVTCPFFDDGQCTVCKCLVEAKVMLNTEKCPRGRWGRRWIKRKLT